MYDGLITKRVSSAACFLSFEDLLSFQRKGLRNGNWRGLKQVTKSFYRACMWYARVKGRIVNAKVVGMILEIVEKLKATVKTRIIQAGLVKAEEMRVQYRKRGIFEWCPQLKAWLRDSNYILYLGLNVIHKGWSV
ncbi:MAG: hypothetical protein ACE5GD_06130 [Candidatus Geothermarchaeales archaeon]